jgi:hypothetical protein
MENIFIYAFIISIIYLIIKFIEMRIVVKENKPLKLLIRDTLLVYFCVISGNFIFEQLIPSNVLNTSAQPKIFTDTPEF